MNNEPEVPDEGANEEALPAELQPTDESDLIQAVEDPDLRRVISTMPAREQGKIISVLMAKSHRGPLPSPETLAGYNAVVPNAAERIIAMAEREGEHRRALDDTVVRRQFNQKGWGQAFGFILGFSSLLIGGFLIHTGHDAAGTIYGGVGVSSLVAVFVTGKYFQSKEEQ